MVTSAPASEAARKKRLRIQNAAAHCFAHQGFVKTTVEEIATAAGVSKGLVYVHFDNKEALLEAVLEATLEEWSQAIRAQVDAKARNSAEALAIMHRSSIEYALQHPLLQHILDRDSRLVLAHVDAPAKRATEEWRRTLQELIQRGVEQGDLREDLDVDRTVQIFQLFHLAFLEQIVEPEIAHIDGELVDASLDILLHGLKNDSLRHA